MCNILLTMQLPLKNKTAKQQQEIIDNYLIDKMSITEIAKKIKYAVSTVYNFLIFRKIPFRNASDRHKKYTINENFFAVVDTEEKAYFLGYLYADGYLHKDKYHIALQQTGEENKEILLKLNKLIESNRPLDFIKMSKYNKRHGLIRGDVYRLNIDNKKMTYDLIKLGCVQKKSLILKFPTTNQVPSHLIRHFIRGYFDGDGCLSFYFPKIRKGEVMQGQARVTSTKEFVQGLGKITNKELGITYHLLKKMDNDKNSYDYQVSGNYQSLRFMEFIYKDCSIRLQRKHDKFIAFMKEIYKKRRCKAKKYIENSEFLLQLLKT